MAESAREFEKRGASLIAISADQREDSVTFASKLGITFPLLADPDVKVALSYGVAMEGDEIAVPAVFVISKEQRVTFKHVGESLTDRPSVSDMLDEVDKLK